MILGKLENIERYSLLNGGFKKAADFLKRADLRELKPGVYDIDGKSVFATIVNENGRKSEDAQLEFHRKYIDIQLVLDGVDSMGWKALCDCEEPLGEFDEAKDLGFFKDEAELFIPVKSNHFAMFFPHDAHLPMISDKKLHKVIVKIAVNQ